MKQTPVTRHEHHHVNKSVDTIADESPLIIDIIYGPLHNRSVHRLATTMRTPGHDQELATGLLFSLGIIRSSVDIAHMSPCPRMASSAYSIELHHAKKFSPHQFNFGHMRYSACGVCASVDLPSQQPIPSSSFSISSSLLFALPEKMRTRQTLFNFTGGVHAAALFDYQGKLMALFEDVGRHNALDKLIGFMVLNDATSLDKTILLLSSRASYEIIQKAAVAHIPVVAVMGAVSTLAVSEASASNICLIGFLRSHRLNIYSHSTRVIDSEVNNGT